MLAVLFVKTCCGPYKKKNIQPTNSHETLFIDFEIILQWFQLCLAHKRHTKDNCVHFFFQNLCIEIVFTSIWTKLAFQHSVSLMSRFILHNSNVFFKNMLLYNFCNTEIHFDLVIKIFLLYKSKTYSKYPTYVLITLKKIHIIFSFWNSMWKTKYLIARRWILAC